MKVFDVAVIGVGGVGSATCLELTKRGMKVLGIDSYTPSHPLSCSKGKTRLFQTILYKEETHLRWLARAYEKWKDLNSETGKNLFCETGFLIVSNDLPKESRPECFHSFSIPQSYGFRYERNAGYLLVEEIVQYCVEKAKALGAEFSFNEKVLAIEDSILKTERSNYFAKKIVVATGGWNTFVPHVPLTLRRSPQIWFESEKVNAPCFAFKLRDGVYYGIPAYDSMGTKMARYDPYEAYPNPESIDLSVANYMVEPLQSVVREFLPFAKPKVMHSQMCLMLLSPDDEFVLTKHSELKNVFVFSGESGHAFKFAPVLAELLADKVEGDK